MRAVALKYGNLLGSPDCKELQLRAGPGTAAAHEVWERLFAIKTALGLDGRATSLLLLEPACPAAFPAVLDLSFVSPGGGGEDTVRAALDSLRAQGVEPEAVRTALFTHLHGDHFDPRLLPQLGRAAVFAPGGLPGARPPEDCAAHTGGLVEGLATPGHGGPHACYLLDLPELDASLCLAGDLVMSQAHYLSLDHPLSFADHGQGRASLERVRARLAARGRGHHLIVPGHDVPFFLTG